MTHITLSGITQEQFYANVKTALETHSGSPIKKEHLVTKAVKTILGQSNEHTIPMVFSNNKGAVTPIVHDKAVSFDASQYNANEYDMGIHGMLDVELAKQIIEYVYASEFWLLAPLMEGVFDTKEEALSFVEQYPTHALSLVVSTNSSAGCVSAVINSHRGSIVLLDEENYRIIKGSESLTLESFFGKIHDVMTNVAAHEHGDECYAVPYLLKNSPFVDYVNDIDYSRSVYGSLDARIAKELIEIVYRSDAYIMGSVQGVPFESKQEAILFTNTFDSHAMSVIASLFDADESASLGSSLIVSSDNGVIHMEERSEHGDSFSESAKSMEEFKEKLPTLSAKIGNADYPNYGAILTTKKL